MEFNQPLVTGQVSCCTDEGCAPVYLLVRYLVERAVTWTTDRYLGNWCTWV